VSGFTEGAFLLTGEGYFVGVVLIPGAVFVFSFADILYMLIGYEAKVRTSPVGKNPGGEFFSK
jgi:hypothetical protein